MKGSLVFKFIVLMLLMGSSSAFAQVYCVSYGNPIPSNQVITGVFSSAQCPYGGGWAYRVQPPSAYLNVCNQSWATANGLGWVTVPSASTLTSCLPPGTIGLTYGTRPIRRPSSNMWICDSTIPSGYRVTQTITDTQCSLDKGYNATRSYIVSNSPSSSSSSSSPSVITAPLNNSDLPSFTTIKFRVNNSCVHPVVYTDTIPDGTPLMINNICFDNRIFFRFDYWVRNNPIVIRYYRNQNQCWVPEGDLFNPAEGARVVLSSACASEGAQFTYDGVLFKHVKSGKCVKADGDYSVGSSLRLTSACSFNFAYEAIPTMLEPSVTYGHIYIHEKSGYCLRPSVQYYPNQPGTGNPTILPAADTNLVFMHRDGQACNLGDYSHKFIGLSGYYYGAGAGGTMTLYNVATGHCVAVEGGSLVNGAKLKVATPSTACVHFENNATQRMLKTTNGLCVKPLSGNRIPANGEQAVLSSDCSNQDGQNNFWRQSNGAFQFSW